MLISKYATRRNAVFLALFMTLGGVVTLGQADERASKYATFICRPTSPGESASAEMVNGATSLVCRPLAVRMHMSDGSMKTIGNVSSRAIPAPDFAHALTPQQINETYNRWLEKTLDIDPAVEHSP
jgi:hypothetical protein